MAEGDITTATIAVATTGEILSIVTCPEELIPFQAPPGRIWVLGRANLEEQYVVEGAFVDRPSIPIPSIKALSVGEEWEVAGVPFGTKVYIDGEFAGNSDAFLTLQFPLPGEWDVQLRPEFPWREASCLVTVS